MSVRAPDCAKLADEKDGLIGTLFAGKYSIEARLGVGGMSVVYKAVDVGLRREAAIKILSRQQLEKETSMVRFQQEARAASNINHPGIVRIFEFGLSDDGQPFLAMEYVKGKTLSEEIELAGRMAPARAIGILTQTCQALDHAHRRGVVHRDLKPSNIMLVRGDKDEELARIVDFGIAKLEVADAESYKLTQTGEIFGSPLYMSPEQCRGQRTNLRSDIYSLACVLYEMLTGEPPFVGVNVLDTMRRHIEEEPISLKERGVQYKHLAELSAVLKRAMAKDPARRYGSMEEFEADLTRVLRGQTSNAERSATADSAAYMAARSAAEPALPVFENAAGSNNSRTQFAVAFAAATLVSVCALSAFLVFRRHEPHRPVTTSSSSPSSADKEFQQKIWTAAQQNGESSLPVADKLLDYARFLHDEKRFESAENQFVSALMIYRKLGSEEQITNAIRETAYNFYHEKKYKQAKLLSDELLSRYEKTLAPDSQELAQHLNVMGNMAREQGLKKEAIAYYQRLLGCAEGSANKETCKQRGLAEVWLADYAAAEGNYEQAIAYNRKAVDDFSPFKVECRGYIVNAYLMIADLYEKLNDQENSRRAKALAESWKNGKEAS